VKAVVMDIDREILDIVGVSDKVKYGDGAKVEGYCYGH
jgi:hypothetical protein